MRQVQVFSQTPQQNISSMCMKCFIMAVMKKNGIYLDSLSELENNNSGWGDYHLAWLNRFLIGEIKWIPQPHLNALSVLLNLTPLQESILEKMNQRNFFSQLDNTKCIHCHA